MEWETRLIHSGFDIDEYTGAASIPIYNASTFNQSSATEIGKYEYGRSGNPTRGALEGLISVLEGGKYGFAFSSGMAAISSAISLLEAGQHILVCRDVYGGTYRVLEKFFPRFGISHTYVDTTDLTAIEAAITPKTKALFLETPSNPLLKITDLRGCVKLAKKYELITIIDNTFMSPYLQRPLELGIDVVVHSATKFLGGHSDVISGVAVVKEEKLANKLRDVQLSFGAILGPQDSWLVMRGIRTLKVRMDAQQATAEKLATWLDKHSLVEKVYYPGLSHHPGRGIHFQQAFGPGCVLSFTLPDGKITEKFLQNKKLSLLAVSLGGVESIMSYPRKMSHAAMPAKHRHELDIGDNLIRLSVGLEALSDLQEDIDKALKMAVS